MRDYGVVRVRFWDWAKRKRLSAEVKEMALYLLTCTHANSLGCYRLPLAYICDDLGYSAKAVAKTLEDLAAVGFIHRDTESGWTWIVDYLQHNPVPNGKVGKAVIKLLEQVPRDLVFYPDLLATLRSHSHIDGDSLPDPAPSRASQDTISSDKDTVSPKSGTHTQTHEHTHEHEHTSASALETVDEVELAFLEFTACAAECGWPKPRGLEADRRKKLKARLLEHGLEGWRQMLANARASDFLRTKFALKLDWVLEPKNFRKVLEGNYGAACSSAVSAPSNDDVLWGARLKDYVPGGFWQETTWGPRPETGLCLAPQPVLERWRGRVAQ